MTTEFLTQAGLVEEALGRCGHPRLTCHNGLFTFRLANGLLVAGRLAENWLLLGACVAARQELPPPARAVLPERWLEANAQLPGGVKLGLDARRDLTLQAEVPLDEELDLAARLAAALSGFPEGRRLHEALVADAASGTSVPPEPGDGREAPVQPASVPPSDSISFRRLSSRGQASAAPAPGADAAPAPPSPALAACATACAEAGWPFEQRSEDRWIIGLRLPDPLYQASLRAEPKGGVSVQADLLALEGLSAASRQALALMLLGACGRLRLARAAIRSRLGGGTAVFEAALPANPSAGEAARACESLHVACRLCGEEVKLLAHHKIAEEYLALGGWN